MAMRAVEVVVEEAAVEALAEARELVEVVVSAPLTEVSPEADRHRRWSTVERWRVLNRLLLRRHRRFPHPLWSPLLKRVR